MSRTDNSGQDGLRAGLMRHRVYGFNGSQVACMCSQRVWRGSADYVDHLAESLRDHDAALTANAKAEVDDLRARLAKVEALADEWEGVSGRHFAAAELRAALANPDAAGEGTQTAVGPAGRPLRVDVDPSSTDGITGRNGSIQGKAR